MREPAATHTAIYHQRLTHQLLRACVRLALVLIAALGASTAQARSSSAFACSPAVSSIQTLWAAGDFDGDKSLDVARVKVTGIGDRVIYSGIDLFTFCRNSAPPSFFDSFSQTGLVLVARDIDADDDQDLVLRKQFSSQALGVWLNDGKGGFSEVEPSGFPGAGKDPTRLGDQNCPFYRLVASFSGKTYASVAQNRNPSRSTLSSPRCSTEIARAVTPGWRDSRQSRAPPSFLLT